MLNQAVLVGRLTKDPTINELGGVKVTNITLAVQRAYKNMDGEYETDFIPCTLLQNIAQNVCEYCKKGDLVSVKGRLQSTNTGMELITEKVTFLSSKKESE